eukprot:m.87728 g.87728  ORF g.87728 m.87728 type:complete len:451 (+) comp15142_c0_seq1:126-1478(+)
MSRGTEKLSGADILQHLQQQPPLVLRGLYKEPANCLVVFTLLNKVARHLVMRLLACHPSSVTQREINHWIRPQSATEMDAAIGLAGQLEVVICEGDHIRLQNDYCNSLRVALAGGGQPWVGIDVKPGREKAVTPEELQTFATASWENLLSCLVQSRHAPDEIVKQTLETAGLVTRDAEGREAISPLGFQFLLQDQQTQLLFYVLHYLPISGLNTVEALSFLFKLCLSSPNKAYPVGALTSNQFLMLQHFHAIGLAYCSHERAQTYYATHLAHSLVRPDAGGDSGRKRFLVVETNFQVFAYNATDLQVELLSHFTALTYRLPTLAVGSITREMVHNAFRLGITGHQIIHFLRVHAHPEMKELPRVTYSPLPQTVSDQILLWEQERARLRSDPGVLYRNFPSRNHYETIRRHAEQLGCLKHSNSERMFLVVTVAGHQPVKEYWAQMFGSGNS